MIISASQLSLTPVFADLLPNNAVVAVVAVPIALISFHTDLICSHTLRYERKARNAELGIFFDDDYDYSQHLRERGLEGAETVLADLSEVDKALKEKVKQGLVLPAEALPSQYENPVGMLSLAAPVTGPRLDMDPDIVRPAAWGDDECHNILGCDEGDSAGSLRPWVRRDPANIS